MTGIGSFTKSDSAELNQGGDSEQRAAAEETSPAISDAETLGTLIWPLVVSACMAHVSGSASSVTASAPVSTAPQSDTATYLTRILEFTTPDGGRTARVHLPTPNEPRRPDAWITVHRSATLAPHCLFDSLIPRRQHLDS
jgi:hypothetical protein